MNFQIRKIWLAVLANVFITSGAVAVPLTFVDLGIIGAAGTYTFDTIGSQNLSTGGDLDTEMGLWDGSGVLLAADDDGAGFPFSYITADLTDGSYYLGISEFQSVFGDGFTNTGSGFEDGESGDAFLNINSVFAASALAGGDGTGLDQTVFFRFEIGSVGAVTEPSILFLMGLGLVGLGFARRRL